MRLRKVFVGVLGLLLVLGMVPMAAIADEVDVLVDEESNEVVVEEEQLPADDAGSAPQLTSQQELQPTDEATQERDEVALKPQRETPVPTVTYEAHVKSIGWQGAATNGGVAGTLGRSLRVEAVKISLPKGVDGGIKYRVYIKNKGWQGWKKNGKTAGTTGKGLQMEALKVKLTGNLASVYDVWYRVNMKKTGWQGWKKNGTMAGTTGKNRRVEALQVVLLPKGASAPAGGDTEPVLGSDYTTKSSVTYRASVADMGWLGWASDGDRAGTFSINSWLDGFVSGLSGNKISNNDLLYAAIMEGKGWSDEVSGGTEVGSAGSGERLQGIRMRLTGTAESVYDIYYRTYVNGEGWLKWAKNNENAGYVASQKGVQVIEVKLVAKGGKAPSSDGAKSYAFAGMPDVTYRGHVQKVGWQDWKTNGEVAGTVGENLRVEALQAKVENTTLSGEIQLRTHVQSIGWQKWVGQGKTSGTSGKALRVEAIRARLTGELAKQYDLYYRVYAQSKGWLGWAKNGKRAGTSGLSLRLEAMQIKLVPKGAAAPGSTKKPFIKG